MQLSYQPHRLSRLVKPLLASQVAKGDDICQAEGEAEQILVADVGDGVPSVFECDAATIPVVRRLCRGKLQMSGFGINAEAGGRTKAAPGQTSIPERNPKLLELAGNLGRSRHRRALALGDARWGRLRNL